VEGAVLRKSKPRTPAAGEDIFAALPEPDLAPIEGSYGIVVAGVGGTGVLTISALLGMAAHLEGKGAAVLDMMGLAQKGGAVMSHLRVTADPASIRTAKIAAGGARLLLGSDLMVAGGKEALKSVDPEAGHILANDNESITGNFTRNADLTMPGEALRSAIRAVAGERATFLEAKRLATALLGDAIGTNLFMVGYAFQKGLLPVGAAAIERAIELNRVAVRMNLDAFRFGRLAAHDPDAVERLSAPVARTLEPAPSRDLDGIVARRVVDLTAYQDRAYALRYRAMVERVQEVEAARAKGMSGLAEAVARYYFKLLAYKDEYEVARLYSDGEFLKRLERQFEGRGRLRFHLAPPMLAKVDPVTGHPVKKAYGPWMLKAFGLLARLKSLRGSAFDPFGYSEERKTERQLIADYEALLVEIMTRLDHENHALVVELASLPEQIRGFGHVKARHLEAAKAREAELLEAFREPGRALDAAE
jgi:indolepyruvate ferredoxin oxidoreductase